MKNFTLVLLLSTLIIGCGKSKEAIFDKCLTQANETYGENLDLKGNFVAACMIDNNFKWDCFNRNNENALLPICYEISKNK